MSSTKEKILREGYREGYNEPPSEPKPKPPKLPLQKLEVDFSDLKEVFDKLEKEIEVKDEKWDLKITRESNGYVLDGVADSGGRMRTVIEDDEIDELKSHEKLLWEVMEYFSFQGTKHDEERIRVVREKQK